jgi:DNA-binding MarR family transcriptional regulator
VDKSLSYDLHKLTARLDRAADGILQRREGISYARFLALFAVRETGGSQRELADWLGLTEPSTSRMVSVLAAEGLLTATKAAGGNRRQVQLTERGAAATERCARLLEGRFEELVRRGGVPYDSYQEFTQRLLGQLNAAQQAAPESWGAA